jgi:hypothetical protein
MKKALLIASAMLLSYSMSPADAMPFRVKDNSARRAPGKARFLRMGAAALAVVALGAAFLHGGAMRPSPEDQAGEFLRGYGKTLSAKGPATADSTHQKAWENLSRAAKRAAGHRMGNMLRAHEAVQDLRKGPQQVPGSSTALGEFGKDL